MHMLLSRGKWRNTILTRCKRCLFFLSPGRPSGCCSSAKSSFTQPPPPPPALDWLSEWEVPDIQLSGDAPPSPWDNDGDKPLLEWVSRNHSF